MSSVSCVASTAPWPGARVIGMAVRDQRPLDRPHRIDVEAADRAAQAGRRRLQDVFRAHGLQICHIGGIANPRTRVTAPLFITSGDLIADRRYDLRARLRGRRRSCGRRRPVRAGGGTRARLCVGVVRARRGARGAGRPRRRASPRSSRRAAADPDDRHGAALHLARLGARRSGDAGAARLCAHAVRPVRAALRPRARGPVLFGAGAAARRRRRRTWARASAPCSISAAAPGSRARRSARMSTGWSASISRRR